MPADFHPMKGPFTTQTLRGLRNSGAMHWRGDRSTGQFGTDPFDSNVSFLNFSEGRSASCSIFTFSSAGLAACNFSLRLSCCSRLSRWSGPLGTVTTTFTRESFRVDWIEIVR